MVTQDRILVLDTLDKDKTVSSLIDPKTLEGKNPLHVYSDQGMWYFRFEHGNVPGPLRGKYTNFKSAKDDAEIYFATRNIKIVDVIS